MVFIYESTKGPYACYDGRYMGGYEDFSMGYYPPNIPSNKFKNEIPEGHLGVRTIIRSGINPKGESANDGIVSMPIIIPPVKNKSYDFYGDLFPSLWEKAENALSRADKIFVLGYSFPPTDIPSTNLFKTAFSKRKTIPNIIIVNPNIEELLHKFKIEFGIPEAKIKILRDYITSDYIIPD